jgi:hypothetical protein
MRDEGSWTKEQRPEIRYPWPIRDMTGSRDGVNTLLDISILGFDSPDFATVFRIAITLQ